MKSMYYVATVVSAYRAAIDAYLADPEGYVYDPKWFDELCKASHRQFTHGFYYNKPTDKDQNYLTSEYTRDYSFVGLVRETDGATGLTTVEQRNKFSVGETIEIMCPDGRDLPAHVLAMWNADGEAVQSAPHPGELIRLQLDAQAAPGDLLRISR